MKRCLDCEHSVHVWGESTVYILFAKSLDESGISVLADMFHLDADLCCSRASVQITKTSTSVLLLWEKSSVSCTNYNAAGSTRTFMSCLLYCWLCWWRQQAVSGVTARLRLWSRLCITSWSLAKNQSMTAWICCISLITFCFSARSASVGCKMHWLPFQQILTSCVLVVPQRQWPSAMKMCLCLCVSAT